jgi:hypothetical protein
MSDTAPRHTEPCGCVYRMIDVPDDVAVGQGWEQIVRCHEHADPPAQWDHSNYEFSWSDGPLRRL